MYIMYEYSRSTFRLIRVFWTTPSWKAKHILFRPFPRHNRKSPLTLIRIISIIVSSHWSRGLWFGSWPFLLREVQRVVWHRDRRQIRFVAPLLLGPRHFVTVLEIWPGKLGAQLVRRCLVTRSCVWLFFANLLMLPHILRMLVLSL